MKTKYLIAVSLLINLGLVAALVVSQNKTPSPASGGGLAAKNDPPKRAAQGNPGTITQLDTQYILDHFHWTELESEDYRQYIANLRAVGCPEETLKDIIIADVQKLFAGRIAALNPASDFKFWVASNTRSAREERQERERQVRQLEQEKRDLVKELLGVDLETELARRSGERNDDDRYAWLAPEKREAVVAMFDKDRTLERELWSEGRGRGEDAREKFMELRQQREAELAQILTPAERTEYDLRTSFTARRMRDTLGSFEPSQTEFQQIFDLKKTFDEEYGFRRGRGDDQAGESRQLAENQMNEQIKSVLGESRYQEYEMANDNRYREQFEFTERNELPKETARQLYDMQKVAEEQKRQVLSDPNIADEQRGEVLRALASETQATVANVLGDRFESYQDRNGRWVRSLESTRTSERGGFDRFNRGGGGGGGGRRGGR